MGEKIRVLGIAPYEGLSNILVSVSAEFSQIELTTYVGDLEQGLGIAKKNLHKNYDAVISRGMTAKLLNQLPIPVVDIGISIYDVLCTMKLASIPGKRTAFVSYADISVLARQVSEITDYEIDIYTVSSPEAAEAILNKVNDMDYGAIICDRVVNQIATKLQINSYLITSGIESIRKAFEEVLAICRYPNNLRNENQLLRELINGQLSETVLFDDKKNVILSTIDSPKDSLISLFENEIEETKVFQERRITRNLDGMVLNIRSKTITVGNDSYVVFFFTSRKSITKKDKPGVEYYSFKEIQTTYNSSMLFLSGVIGGSQIQADRIKNSYRPVLIYGENGTGKDSFAHYLFLNGNHKNSPFIEIDCYELDDKGWDYIFEHHMSPLTETKCTIYIKNLGKIPTNRGIKLVSTLSELGTCNENRVIFSCLCNENRLVPRICTTIADRFGALSVYMPPLRSITENIDRLARLTLNNLTLELNKTIYGFSEEAMNSLRNYSWPNNFTQFKRVISELAIFAKESIISQRDVAEIMQKETYIGYTSDKEEDFLPINLRRPLKEIEHEIVSRILGETGNNQTEAANILQVSRTTLWRMLKPEEKVFNKKS